ncbi:MmgE/PrpD family protein [Bordetella pertussis]
MGLTADQLQSAYGLTLHQTGTTLQCHHGPGSDVRGFRDGFGARNGVTAAYMARAGLRGDPEAFEGKYGFYGAFFRASMTGNDCWPASDSITPRNAFP